MKGLITKKKLIRDVKVKKYLGIVLRALNRTQLSLDKKAFVSTVSFQAVTVGRINNERKFYFVHAEKDLWQSENTADIQITQINPVDGERELEIIINNFDGLEGKSLARKTTIKDHRPVLAVKRLVRKIAPRKKVALQNNA